MINFNNSLLCDFYYLILNEMRIFMDFIDCMSEYRTIHLIRNVGSIGKGYQAFNSMIICIFSLTFTLQPVLWNFSRLMVIENENHLLNFSLNIIKLSRLSHIVNNNHKNT